jgi:hypothetical protein
MKKIIYTILALKVFEKIIEDGEEYIDSRNAQPLYKIIVT